MSYILEALKKTDQLETPADPVTPSDPMNPIGGAQPTVSSGLSLTWKLVLGAFAVMNLGLLGLLYTGAFSPTANDSPGAISTARQSTAATGTDATPTTEQNAATVAQTDSPPIKQPPNGTRPLPGIVSPRLTPPPAAKVEPAPRVYGPALSSEVGEFGTAPTNPAARAAAERAAIAALENATNGTLEPSSSTSPSPTAPTIGPALLPERSGASATTATPATRTQQLVQLDPAARARLQNLNFSTHIYGTDADLRAVVVNGIRVVEGQSQGGFLLRNIVEDGVIIEFEHGGITQRVMIPVLEDWKD